MSKKNNENFSDWRFFPLATGVNDTVMHPELRISPGIFGKIQNGPNGVIRGLGKLIHVESLKSKISWHCPFKWYELRRLHLSNKSIIEAYPLPAAHPLDNTRTKYTPTFYIQLHEAEPLCAALPFYPSIMSCLLLNGGAYNACVTKRSI